MTPPLVKPSDKSTYTRGIMVVDYRTSYLLVFHLGDGETVIYDRFKTLARANKAAQRVKAVSRDPYASPKPTLTAFFNDLFK